MYIKFQEYVSTSFSSTDQLSYIYFHCLGEKYPFMKGKEKTTPGKKWEQMGQKLCLLMYS